MNKYSSIRNEIAIRQILKSYGGQIEKPLETVDWSVITNSKLIRLIRKLFNKFS